MLLRLCEQRQGWFETGAASLHSTFAELKGGANVRPNSASGKPKGHRGSAEAGAAHVHAQDGMLHQASVAFHAVQGLVLLASLELKSTGAEGKCLDELVLGCSESGGRKAALRRVLRCCHLLHFDGGGSCSDTALFTGILQCALGKRLAPLHVQCAAIVEVCGALLSS